MWIGQKGAPDRMLAFKGAVFFVELKSEDGALKPEQVREHTKMQDENLSVTIIRSIAEVNHLITQIISICPLSSLNLDLIS